LWRYESSKFLIFISKIRVKSETLAMKNVIPTAKNRIFLDTCFGLKLDISGTLAYNFFQELICEKKKEIRDEK
jgi:hypothetical protein